MPRKHPYADYVHEARTVVDARGALQRQYAVCAWNESTKRYEWPKPVGVPFGGWSSDPAESPYQFRTRRAARKNAETIFGDRG
jgi:hypothetical protein